MLVILAGVVLLLLGLFAWITVSAVFGAVVVCWGMSFSACTFCSGRGFLINHEYSSSIMYTVIRLQMNFVFCLGGGNNPGLAE